MSVIDMLHMSASFPKKRLCKVILSPNTLPLCFDYAVSDMGNLDLAQ